MVRHFLAVVALALLVFSPAPAQQPTLVVQNGRVITGDGAVMEEAAVVVAGEGILSLTREPGEAPEARRIDASGKTVLPGLIDAHVHLTIPPDGRDSTALVNYLDDGVAEVLQGFLEHGVTTVRSTGDYWPWIGALRDSVAAGDLQGPRIRTAGPVVTAAGGHPATTVCARARSDDRPNPFCRSQLAREVTSPEEARQAVQTLADEGVNFIKFVSDDLIAPVQIEDSVVRAIVEQAHRDGLKAMGHVAQIHFMTTYVGFGIDGYVHPPTPSISSRSKKRTRRLARVLTRHGTPVTTTFAVHVRFGVSHQPADSAFTGPSPPWERLEVAARDVSILAEEGVPIVVGTDWCACGPNSFVNSLGPGRVTITEMKMLRWGGMSRHAIIQAATANAARALEMDDQVGTLEAGKLADMIVVDGNPLEDLSALEEVEVVVQGGEVVHAR